MSDDPLIYPGDMQQNDPIRRRSEEEVQRELAVNRARDRARGGAPGGAEGGDEHRAADFLIDVPGDRAPFGDTSQHSDPDNLPRHRQEENENRGQEENENRG